MDKVSKKSLKPTNGKDKKLSKKIKQLAKESKLEENLDSVQIVESVPKLKKIQAEIASEIKINDHDVTQVPDSPVNGDNNQTAKENIHPTSSTESISSAIILNLPPDATKEELNNFLSNRGIPVASMNINNNNYCLIESEDSEVLEKIQKLISQNPLLNNENMKPSSMSGNAQKLHAFCQRRIIQNRNVVVVKNINVKTDIENVLSLIPSQCQIKKHTIVKIRNKKQKTQLLTIEFQNNRNTDLVIESINNVSVDSNILIAEFQLQSVDSESSKDSNLNPSPTVSPSLPSTTIMIKDLPESIDYQSIKDLELPTTRMQLVKKSAKRLCFLSFKTVEEAKQAYESLFDKEINGVKISSVKFVQQQSTPSSSACPDNHGNGDLDLTRLHVTNLPFHATKDEMEKEFDFAQSIKFPLNAAGKSKGVCYLSFASAELAALARESLKDRVIGGRKIKCQFSKKSVDPTSLTTGENDKQKKNKTTRKRGARSKPADNVITLFNLPKTVQVADIKSKFDHVKMVNIVKKDEVFKGIAEVHFVNAKFAKAAIEGAEFSIGGRVIRKELKGGKWRTGVEKNKSNKKESQDESDGAMDE